MSFGKNMNHMHIKLLIVEDSVEDAELLIHFLKKNDFTIDYKVVDTAEEMDYELEEEEYNLVISDFSMPQFSGLEALKIAKASDPLLPFILISGYINQQQESEILMNGANEVIMKNNLNRLPFAVLRVLHEVDDKRKLKKLIATKDKLFSVIAHDLRGTLEAIHILSETMKNDVGKPEHNESFLKNLKMISESAKSTNLLLGNLLKWALMQIGSFQPEYSKLDIQQCLTNSVEVHKANAKRKNLNISLAAIPIEITGDNEMLSIVFRNLISNAINYSQPGSEINVEVEDKENEVVVSVIDHGIGMSEEIKAKLFDPSDRPKRTGTNNEQSTGFGLLLCNDIVTMHGGNIEVDSQVGKGSTFKVTLPKELNHTPVHVN